MESSDRADHVAGALTYPNPSEQGLSMQPRRPTNLQTLLRFAIDATNKTEDDGPTSSAVSALDEERRRFLEEALKSLTVDVPKVLQRGIKILTNVEFIKSVQLGQPVPDDIRAAFNNMMEFVDDIDVAMDFQKLGGFAVFPICYGSENEDIRIRTSQLLAEICQNNPHCQERVLEYGLLNVLLHLANSEKGYALAKCISAISCTVREYDPGCRELIAQGGCDTLTNALEQPHVSARTKAAFLIRYLCQNYPDAKEKFIQNNIVKIIAEKLKSGRDASSEQILSVLQTLLEGQDPTVLQQFREPTLNLKQIIIDHLDVPEFVGDGFIEEKEYCYAVLRVFDSCPQVEVVNSEVDR
ncbi:hsp70-binding protein 1 [Vanessa tameamea]|uniref:Hsp70-binding protein 1 n=1 Tax=Vanessa tameamea TaxID=334116 RepID=A0A8B8HR99_VANTA|nr:hsp70-binding protein 1 [Vanessa tameamea]